MKATKKPVTVDYWTVRELLRCARSDWKSLPSQIEQAYERGDVLFIDKTISISTMEGLMEGSIDDLIICGVLGELYPCKPEVFAKSYNLERAGEEREP